MPFRTLFSLSLAFALTASAADRVLWDFESGTYTGWTVEGKEAFGKTPFDASVVSTWPAERQFRGWHGRYMIIVGDTRHKGTPPGKLVSDEFEITHRYLNFLYGAETNPEVRVYLTVGGKEVRNAYGNNSYDMRLRGWDVGEFRGRKARLVVQDTAEAASLIRLDYFHLSDTPPPALGEFARNEQETSLLHYGEFRPVYDPGPGKYLVYACVLRASDGKWHLFATQADYKDRYALDQHRTIVHAVSSSITAPDWKAQEHAIVADARYGETLAWDPYVIEHEGVWYMFYVGSGTTWKGWDPKNDWRKKEFGTSSQGPYGIHLATSKDGVHWTRHGDKPLFTDFPFAFTPFVRRAGSEWVMYYGGVEPAAIMGKHAILTRTSKDLIHWENRRVAMIDETVTTPWPEHSFFHDPFVWQRGGDWYLLAGPIDNGNQSRFHYRKLYRSADPMHFDMKQPLKGLFLEGGSKFVRDADGKEYTWYTGQFARALWIAPVVWDDVKR